MIAHLRKVGFTLKHRKFWLIVVDILSAALVCWFMLDVFPVNRGRQDMTNIWENLTVIVGLTFLVRVCFRIYSRVWRYSSTRDYCLIILSDMIAGLLYCFVDYKFLSSRLSFIWAVSIYAMIALITLLSRFLYRLVYDKSRQTGVDRSSKINVAIVGAGNVGTMLAKELQRNPASHYKPYCFIDTDPHKIGSIISGIKVLGEGEDVVAQFETLPVQEIIIALPKLTGDDKTAIYNRYSKTGCKVKIYDYPLDSGSEGAARVLREFKIEDLLFREAKSFDIARITPVYQGKTVLVTGGGGSIGSELCRQVARLRPERLVIFDCYENNAYDIEQELTARYAGKLELSVEIGSVRDRERLDEVFSVYRPQIVFHAAAHKHVPLMEHSCAEAIKNNVMGTYNAVCAAEKYSAERFLLVSTDKAVNPTNVMGASKRLCEMIVQSRKESATSFMAVRFGNVLGSNGSVIPLFTRQIKAGGPITLTDKRIIRYFMTIPEAAQLLLTTCAIATSGEIYVLDMGKPVKILEMAENMIRLSGLTPYEDIDIQEVGLRPGEKLYEELLLRTEELDRTENDMIYVERDHALSRAELEDKLRILGECLSGSREDVIAALKKTVPTFHSPEEVNSAAQHVEEMLQDTLDAAGKQDDPPEGPGTVSVA